jgi:beta-1,4-mannosyltransferase
MRAAIVVLGDFGRSPRMQYHALALADSGVEVDVVAYAGTPPFSRVAGHPLIHLRLFEPSAFRRSKDLDQRDLVGAFGRLLLLAFRLFRALAGLSNNPDLFLVQNPPGLPTIPIALLFARMHSARLAIDWHNSTCSMLALGLGKDHLLVRLVRLWEAFFSRRADAQLCVSRAMQADLQNNWGIRDAVVFYDRPAGFFAPADAQAKNALLARVLGNSLVRDNEALPAIVVSPTSWTRDEDMGVLLEAAQLFDDQIAHYEECSQHRFPGMVIAITGQGPMREAYQNRIDQLALRKVRIRTLWLSPEDYALLLGSSDLGVSCHHSSSGLDLPMKICDLLGAGVPVSALNYGPCLGEQLRHEENGLYFADARQLADQLFLLFRDFPLQAPMLEHLRNNIARSRRTTWSEGWNEEARPVLLRSFVAG